MTLEWKDVTTYSRHDTERKPTTYQIVDGHLRIVITCGHIYYKPAWIMHCFQIGIDTKKMKANNLEEAKREAMRITGEAIDLLRKSYDKIYEDSL